MVNFQAFLKHCQVFFLKVTELYCKGKLNETIIIKIEKSPLKRDLSKFYFVEIERLIDLCLAFLEAL